MKFILHQLISYMNEKYKKDQSDETRMQISKLNSFEFKLHKFIQGIIHDLLNPNRSKFYII